MMKVGVSEEPIEPSHDGKQVLGTCLGDIHTRIEILAIVDNGCGMIERVDHVINGRALDGCLMGGTKVEPLVCCFHFGTELFSADTL